MIKCDRQAFILIAQGILLDRDEKGVVKIGDTEEAHKAWVAHQKGEPIHLTPHGTVIQNGVERFPTIKDIAEIAPKLSDVWQTREKNGKMKKTSKKPSRRGHN